MPTIQSPFVSLALGRLRRGVTLCCWVIALSLLTQALVWCFATFTQVRYSGGSEVSSKSAPIVISSERRREQEAAAQAAAAQQAALTVDESAPAAPPLGRNDKIFTAIHSIAQATGTFAMLMLLPLLTLGVLLGAGSATVGVEQTVSAFIWSIAIAILILPMGEFIGLPWTEGALTSYAMTTHQVDAQLAGTAEAWSSATFYARFALLPLACVAGVAMTGLRFASGVSAGITPKENLRLDPVLEKEAANMKASSLHGGRAGGALRAAGVGVHSAANGNGERKAAMAGATAQLTAGEAPRRLI